MGNPKLIELFYLLKTNIEKTYHLHKPECKRTIHNWTKEDINDFIFHLEEKTHERISERWFYLHIKPEQNEKLPRIDMLTILCKYCELKSWDSFILEQSADKEETAEKEKKEYIGRPNKMYVLLGTSALIIICVIVFLSINSIQTQSFCFYSYDTNLPIQDTEIEIIMLNDEESPTSLFTTNGCFTFESADHYIKFLAKARYFKPDTIERRIKYTSNPEILKLKTDDYALLIHCVSNIDIKDWEKRRNQLNRIIHNDAAIFQIDTANHGMEMYNKTEFIDKMTMPLQCLKNIEIVESVYKEGQIINLRFTAIP